MAFHRMRIMNWTQLSSYIRKSYQQLKRVEFVSDRMSYIILRGCWCEIIILNVHAPAEDKIDDMKISFSEELQ
jgi:hypothetical protein